MDVVVSVSAGSKDSNNEVPKKRTGFFCLVEKALASPSKAPNVIWYGTDVGLALSRILFESKASETSSLDRAIFCGIHWLEKGVPKLLTEGSGPRVTVGPSVGARVAARTPL